MNLVQLKYFQTISSVGSVSAASEILHISQPSLSAAIKSLEDEFGVLLFKRHHKGVSLTAEGEELFKLSVGLTEHAEEISRIMNDVCGKKRVLRLGVPPMIGSVMLPKIYSEFLTAYPEVQIDITESGRGELMNHLSNRRVDGVLLPHYAPFGKGFTAVKVCDFEIVCCLSAVRKTSGLKTVVPSDLKDEPIVLFKDSFFQTEQIKKWFLSAGIEPKVIMQTDQLSTLKNLITSGVATGFMFSKLITPSDRLIQMKMDGFKPVSVSFVKESENRSTATLKAFTEYVKNYKL
ncbi:MAG: LysR family transcriptional regulator [Clostridia bacterium]|nr:LysR family transcriptional regulator [Clostridia bacterium]